MCFRERLMRMQVFGCYGGFCAESNWDALISMGIFGGSWYLVVDLILRLGEGKLSGFGVEIVDLLLEK
jgi:hypothetical protein